MIQELKKLKCGKVIDNVDLKKYTTYKLNEKAKVLVNVDNETDLLKLLKFIKENNYKYKIIGGGSNLIFAGYYDGILIKLDLNKLKINKNIVEVESGYNLMTLSLKVSKMGLTGMEFSSGIPGTIGGAIMNNAGAYKSDMGYIVRSAKVITPNLEIKELTNKEMDFHYRTSFFKKNPGYVILSAKIVLDYGNKDEIIDIIKDRKKRRLESQPLEYPSAGSVFRNPDDLSAWKLVEDVGYKGKSVGDAMVSLKHANFIINNGNAKGSDIIKLIEEIKQKVIDKYNVELVLEQEIVR